MAKYVVLNDGETFTSIQGCRILTIPDSEAIDEFGNDTDNFDQLLKDRYRAGEGLNIEDLLKNMPVRPTCHNKTMLAGKK